MKRISDNRSRANLTSLDRRQISRARGGLNDGGTGAQAEKNSACTVFTGPTNPDEVGEWIEIAWVGWVYTGDPSKGIC